MILLRKKIGPGGHPSGPITAGQGRGGEIDHTMGAHPSPNGSRSSLPDVADVWRVLEAKLPPDTPPAARRLLRRAYYNGATTMFNALMALADCAEPEAMDLLERTRLIIAAYEEDVRADRD